MADIKDFSTTAANNNSTPPDGAPEGMAPSTVNNVIRELMAAIRRQWEQAEWFDFGDTITYASGTSFTVATDLTARYQVGCRVRATGSTTGTIYGVITASAFTTVTTVTVEWDSGSLQSEALAVAVGIASATNKSIDYKAIARLIAENISYDPSDSTTPLTATNIKAALDELDSNFNTTITSTAAAAAGAAALQYTYSSTTTMADPTTGYVKLNNSTISSVTAIAIDDQLASTGNPDISAYIATWDDTAGTDKGTLVIRDASDTSKFAIFQITGLTDNAGWAELAVTYIDGAGTFTNDGDLFLNYFRHGDDFTVATQAEAEAGTDNTKGMTPLRTAQAIDARTDDLAAVDKDILPATDSTYDLGSALLKWAQIYGDTVGDGTATAPMADVVNGSARAWVNFDGTGTVAIRDSYNVSSITDNGVGDYTVNFSTAMPDNNYCINATPGDSTNLKSVTTTARTTTSLTVITGVTGGTGSSAVKQDLALVTVSVNGN